MSQLGGQIQTIDAPIFLGIHEDENGMPRQRTQDKNPVITNTEPSAPVAPKNTYGPSAVGPTDEQRAATEQRDHTTKLDRWKARATHHPTMSYTGYVPVAKHAPGHDAGHAAPGSSPIRAPRYERVVYPPQPHNPFSETLYRKNPLNNYTYSSWPTHWPDGTPRTEPLPVEWDPSKTNVYNKPLKGPYDPSYNRRQKLKPGHGQYHTHWADGSERTNRLDPNYQNPGTHDDRGRRVKPPDYHQSTHFPNFKLKPVYDPNRPKKTPSLPEQHTQHEHVEIQKLQEKVKELQKSNQQKDNQIKQAKEAKAATAAKHALLRQQQSEIAPTTQRHSRAISATRGTSTSRPATTAAAGAARERSRSRAKTPVGTRPLVRVEYEQPYVLHDGGSSRSGRRRGRGGK